MSTYGHPQAYGSGSYGSSGHGSGAYDDAYDAYDGYTDSYAVDSYGTDPYPDDRYDDRRRATPAPPARASGAAPAGRARVSASAAVAAAPVARPDEATGHRYDWAGAGQQRPAGRASVPVSPAVGSPAGGRAKVGGPGGPSRPGDGAGPGRGGSGPKRKKKRHWIRNSLLSLLAVLIIATGGGMVALSYYVESVPPPDELALPESSTIYFADGDEMAVLQQINREIVDTTGPEYNNVKLAVLAAEDKGFLSHKGVDFFGIVRAAINNFTGGETQGASTIDQQYAGAAADIRSDASYTRKLEEAAMAYNMNRELGKDEILDHYLNTIYFGRGAYGIQAAAQAYYRKDAQDLELAEAAVIAGCIRLPDLGDGSGFCPYDPRRFGEEDLTAAENRFQYVLAQMVDMGQVEFPDGSQLQLTAAERDALELPMTKKLGGSQDWHEGPQGNIVRQVIRELEAAGYDDLSTGGYRITTTIDPDIQEAALAAARRENEGPMWENIAEEVAAGLVAIDPATGAVLAYYGGDDGTGVDLAGINDDPLLDTGRAPGSTMKIYTLIAAMREGVSFDSKWQTRPYTPAWASEPIRNAGRGDPGQCEGDAPDNCTLRWNTINSFNVAFSYFSEAMGFEGPARVVQAAMDAGIRTMYSTDCDTDEHADLPRSGNAIDLTALDDISQVAPECFFHQAAFGQYPITVLDHASGVATLAARGLYHEPHFVALVEEKDANGDWVAIYSNQISGDQRIQVEHADAITGVLAQIPSNPIMGSKALANGRPSAAKTGTWEHPNGGNRDAWVVGYTPQIAAAVWTGDPKNGPIKDVFGGNIGSSGLPADIWKAFMDAAHEAGGHEHVQFPPAPAVGNPQHPFANGIEPEPEEDEENPFCRGPFRPAFCDDENGDNGDNNGGDDNGGQNNGGNIGLPPPPPGLPGAGDESGDEGG